MPDEAQLLAAAALAVAATFAATPLAIAVASKTNFQDRPVGYKGHAAPTPYLGGAAVLCGFVLGTFTIGSGLGRLLPLVAGAAALWVLGTVDDRKSLGPGFRLAVEAAIAIALWASGLGWSAFGSEALNLTITVLWVLALVNAFNLMDNMDGAAGTVGAVAALAVAALAFVSGDTALAALAAGMAGACAGFLPYNLTRPARIFLGDGGSLPIGFIVAGSLMAVPAETVGWPFLLAAVLLAGVPVLDTTLVIISRRRAGVPVLSGGRDHLTHRLITRLGSQRKVALTLGSLQAVLGAVAIGVVELGRGSVIVAWSVWFVAVAAAVAMLETEGWAPARGELPMSSPPKVRSPRRRLPVSIVEAATILFITLACGLSPFLYGFYDVSVWGPIALFILAGLVGLLIGRPAVPPGSALLAAAGLVALWLWAFASTGWAESAGQALVDANRWMFFAALFGVLVVLLRNDRLGRLLVAAVAAVITAFGLYLVGRMVLGSGSELFLGPRLNEPLGYVNGQAGYLLIGLWPLVALAERVNRPLQAAFGAAGATVLAGLAVLSQTRAAIPAVVLSTCVLVALVPGRGRRAWALVCVAAGVLVAAGPLLHVYDATPSGRTPSDSVLETASGVLLVAAFAVGAVWAALCATWGRTRHILGRPGPRLALTCLPILLVAAGTLAVFVSVADPVGRVEREYRNFTQLHGPTKATSRFTSGAGNRYDYWRIAADQFSDHPIRGVGAGNYDATYFRERHTAEDVRQAHSLELQVLGELGLVGGVALALFLLGIAAGFLRRARAARRSESDRLLVVAAGGAFLVWFLHTSVDWLHLIPGVTGLALAAAAVLVAPWRSEAVQTTTTRRVVIGCCLLLALLGAVEVGRSALAVRDRSAARNALRTDAAKALSKADDSLALNDEDLSTYYVKAAAYARINDYTGARRTLAEAARREPHDFITWVLLGDLAVRRGELIQARRAYGTASGLNPRDRELRRMAARPRSALDLRSRR